MLEPEYLNEWMSEEMLRKKIALRGRDGVQVSHLVDRADGAPTLLYTAYELAYLLGRNRVGVDVSDSRLHAVATCDDGALVVVYADFDPDVDGKSFNDPDTVAAFVEPGNRTLEVVVHGIPCGMFEQRVYGILGQQDAEPGTMAPLCSLP